MRDSNTRSSVAALNMLFRMVTYTLPAMISKLTTSSLTTLLSLAAFGILITPASAQEYKVTVTLLGDSTIPAPLSYTFDTTTPFQTTGTVAISNLSVVFDSACGSVCSVDSVDYNANEVEISYKDGSFWWESSVGCSTFLSSGSCTTNPSINVSQVGVIYGNEATGGTVLVTAVPEPSQYLELAGIGFGLGFWGFIRRFSSKQRS
jgi:hypothetical protein